MSGGSLDYVYGHVRDAAEFVFSMAMCAEHRAFATHLRLVAEALHDFEWVMSGDTRHGEELPAIRKVVSKADVLDEAVKHALMVRDELTRVLTEIKD